MTVPTSPADTDINFIRSLPGGLADEICNLFDVSTELTSPYILNAFRQLLERMMKCLCMQSGSSYDAEPLRTRFRGNLENLKKSGTILEDIAEYLEFWWWLGSFGSHDQTASSCTLDEYVRTCRVVARVVLQWYVDRFQPIDLSSADRSLILRHIQALAKIPLDDVVYPASMNLEKLLQQHDLLLLTGESWTGKTCLASLLAREYMNKGYIPIPFHERSLKMPLSTYHEPSTEQTKHWMNAVAGRLNRLICTRLLYGEAFVILLDDPFGHRDFRFFNPFTRFPLARWLALSQESHVLGKIKVIVTSTASFLMRAKSDPFLQDADPIAHENLALIEDTWNVPLSLDRYSAVELSTIIHNVAASRGCVWAHNPVVRNLVAEEIISHSSRFDALFSYCRDTRHSTDESTLVEKAIVHFGERQNVEDHLKRLPGIVQSYLCAVLVGDTVRSLLRDREFHTPIVFSQVCDAAATIDCVLDPRYADVVSQWVENEAECLEPGDTFPSFKHPEIFGAVEEWALDSQAFTVCSIIAKICGWGGHGGIILLWEAVPLSCRFARFLDESVCDEIDNGLFRRPKGTVVEVDRVLWSIVRNWFYVSGSRLEPHAFGFLKRVKNDFSRYIRSLIRELAENWSELTDELRWFTLEFNSDGKGTPKADDRNVLAFMSAVFANYNLILASARAGSSASGACLEYLATFVEQLIIKRDIPAFPSKIGDQIWENPTLRPTGRETLDKLIAIGIQRGALQDASQIVKNIRVRL